MPLPLSTSEQVGIFWGFFLLVVFFFSRTGLSFHGKAACETKITWPLVLGRPPLNLIFLLGKMGVCGCCERRKNVGTSSCKVLAFSRYSIYVMTAAILSSYVLLC